MVSDSAMCRLVMIIDHAIIPLQKLVHKNAFEVGKWWMVFWCAKLQFTWCRWDALGPVSDVLEVGEEVVEGDAGGGRQVGAQARERDPWLEGARLRPDPGVGDKWQRRLDCEVKGNSCQNFKPNSGSSALCFWKAMQLYDQWSMCMIARMWGIF